jgi:hypothetical protein
MKKVLLPVAALVLSLSMVMPAIADVTAALWAGNGAIHVGSVTVSNDGSALNVTYDITLGGWLIAETHVAVGESVEDIPQTNSGNPKIGHFDSSSEHDPGVITVTHTIPLDGMTGTIVIAAHAVVYNPEIPQEETAWARKCGEQLEFEGNNWATYFTYVVQ